MGSIGTKRNTKKLHAEIVGLEAIIDKMGQAMRAAHLPYVADSGRLTLRMQDVIQEFVWFAMKVKAARGPR